VDWSSYIFLRLVIENNNVVGEERLLADEGERFRDVQQGKDERLHVPMIVERYRIDKK
jgi:glucose/arabinose dehydrogenase